MLIGLLHPGEMGAAVGATLKAAGHDVLWASDGRSAATAERATQASLRDVGTIAALAAASDVILSVCPPHAALEVASALTGFSGIYVDANAISPMTARAVAQLVQRCVDGGIVGPPPTRAGTTRLYLSGTEAEAVAALFTGTVVDAPVLSEDVGSASALKLAYAAWTKGRTALLLAVRAAARSEGVEQALIREWSLSQPDLPDLSVVAARAALTKGWRWAGEMSETADMFAGAGLPDGFHRAAAELYDRVPRGDSGGEDPLDLVVTRLLR